MIMTILFTSLPFTRWVWYNDDVITTAPFKFVPLPSPFTTLLYFMWVWCNDDVIITALFKSLSHFLSSPPLPVLPLLYVFDLSFPPLPLLVSAAPPLHLLPLSSLVTTSASASRAKSSEGMYTIVYMYIQCYMYILHVCCADIYCVSFATAGKAGEQSQCTKQKPIVWDEPSCE